MHKAVVDHGQFFSKEELQCRCGQYCGYSCPMDADFIQRLDDLRAVWKVFDSD